MSIPVDLADVPKTLEDFDRGYLLTTTDGRVKAVSVRAVPADGALRVANPGRGSVANVGANPTATLLFPPAESGGLTLLVDGSAVAEGDDVVMTPSSAILHRSVGGAVGAVVP
ncbi:pyridoxamine 5'-phosphate oxidase [Nocardioides sp.]|uniref:pyridoxamine 5'-phosphate oxidase n=1 Tax=Nocardioides sp. TaxID=35761 RepID=UPI0025E55E98|nr:pyridoxamine 5'-phosphate oxidase [Nocardioides sp.]